MLRSISALMISCVLECCILGCGSSGAPSSPGGPLPAPSITTQPANQSVPMGLTGSFSVVATGTGLQYQWSRNGSPISGATSSTYVTDPTQFSDTGETFTVSVRNGEGSVTSQAASLTITARAPKAGDLRFQQVDAASTIHGYVVQQSRISNVACPAPGGGGTEAGFGGATGTAFFLINDECMWQFDTFAVPSGVTGLEMGYAGVAMQDYQNVLVRPFSPQGPSPSDTGSVITSLSLEDASAGVGFIHSDSASGFIGASHTVSASALQAAATQEGLSGRVITAISYDGSQATYFAYGWTNDPSSIYESKVVFSTLATATADIESLAKDGYILTASGSTQAADGSGLVLLGTRVQDDVMPRPILVGDALAGTVAPLMQQGYAVVAVVNLLQNNALVLKNYIGER